MRIGPDVIQSISENQVDISSGWAFTSSDAYSPRYTEIISNPISLEATTLDYLRFKDSVTDIVIRSGYDSNSPILWAGQSFNISDTEETSNYHNDLSNIQGGIVGEYYHLSATQYNQLTSGGDTSLHNHSFDRNRSNHTGTQLASTISDFTSASRMLLSATTPIVYTSATGVISHSTIGSAGTYTKVVTNATGHVTSGSVLTSADIPSLDWSKITTGKPTTLSGYGISNTDTLFDSKYVNQGVQYTNPIWLMGIDASIIKTGTIDVARIPVLPSQVPQVTTNLASLTTAQQNIITSGTIVTTSDDGWRYVYSGTGSKTASASYVLLADISPEWTAIANRPTTVSTWSNDAGYLTNITGDARYSLTGHLHNGLYLTSTSALNPANVVQTASYRFVTDTEKNTWNDKLNRIPTNITNGNANTLTTNGVYGGYAIANTPNATWFIIKVYRMLGDGGDQIWQIGYSSYGGNETFQRYSADYGVTWSNWDRTQKAITLGTTAQYFRGDLSLATFPTNLSSFTNGPGYLTASTGKAQFSLPPTTSVITWFKIGTIGTVSDVGSGQANLMLDSYANYNYGGNQAPWESIRFASRSSIFLEARSMLGAGAGNTYGYTTNGAVLELWVKTTSLFTPNIIYQVNSAQGVGVSYGLLFQTGTEPSGITYVTTKTIYDDRYAPIIHNQDWSTITSKPTTISNFVDGTWAGASGYYGWSFSGGSTRFGFSSTGGVVDVYADGNFYAGDAGNLVWHAGNLIGNVTGHYHASDRMWGNISGVPANVQNPQNYYLPLSGGTLAGPLTGTTSTFTDTIFAPTFASTKSNNYPNFVAGWNSTGVWGIRGSQALNSNLVEFIRTTNWDGTGVTGLASIRAQDATFSGLVTAGKGLVKSSAIGFGAFFGTVDTGTLATTVGTIVDETSTQTYYSQKTGGNHSFYINGTQTASIDAGGINGVGNLSIANIGNGGIRLYGETVTGTGTAGTSPILKYGFSTVIANTGYVRFPVSIQGAIVVINGKAYGAPVTSTTAVVQSGTVYQKGAGTATSISCDERRMFIGNGTDWFEV